MGKMSTIPDHIGSDDDVVLLLPFSHQIGGHNIVLQYDDSTICKLLNTREKYFYETIPQDLKEYLPKYKGTIQVKIEEDEKGSKKFLAYHHGRIIDNNNNNNNNSNGDNEIINSGSDNDDLIINNKNNIDNNNESNNSMKRTHSKILTTTTSTNYMNPTIAKLQKTFLNKIDSSNDNFLNFLLLENMVAKYKYPCILDIKMGTQQHGDDASEQKKQLQTLKCQMSTSSKIGSRLCGMQVYQLNTRKYICYDKYEGRTLSVDGFKRNLLQYLNNGIKFRTDVIDPIIEKLERLYQIIKFKSTYRFYGSSLLILYDGLNDEIINNSNEFNNENINNNNNNNNIKVDVRMIDFAHSTHCGYKDSKKHSGPDKGYLFGLDNLIKIFKEIKNDCIERQLETEQTVYCNNDDFLNNVKLREPIVTPPEPTPQPCNNQKNVFFIQQQNEAN